MKQKSHHGLTTHVYGTSGLIAGAIGILVSINGTTGIYQWLLLASGWLVSIFLTWFLIRTSSTLTSIIEQHDTRTAEAANLIGKLEQRIIDLQNEIDRRHATLDYLGSLLMTRTATPRQTSSIGNPQQEDT